MSGYDLWKTTEPCNADDYLIEQRKEELMSELSDMVAENIIYSWFDECIDWDKVEIMLEREAEEWLKGEREEAQISAWENRQKAREAECFGW